MAKLSELERLLGKAFGDKVHGSTGYRARLLVAVSFLIRDLMRNSGLTVRTLAERAGVSPTTVQRLLHAQNVGLETFLRLLWALDVEEEVVRRAIDSLYVSTSSSWHRRGAVVQAAATRLESEHGGEWTSDARDIGDCDGIAA